MFKKKKYATAILALLFIVLPSCISPDAVKTEIQGIRNEMGQLEKLVEQKADNTVVAEQVDQVNNRIEQITQVAENLSVWRKNIEAGVIYYGGAVWVIVGTSIMAVIFIGAGLLLVRAFLKRGHLLTLLTCAIQKVGKSTPEVARVIKDQLRKEVADGKFGESDRQDLGNFSKRKGTFCEQK